MARRRIVRNEPGAHPGPQAVDPSRGLSQRDVAERVASGRSNDAPDPRSRSLSDIVRSNVVTSFNIVIGVLWALMIVAGAALQDSLFGFIIVINSSIGIVQEYRAKRTLERLSVVGEAKPVVRREGVDSEVSPAALVQDDVVVLRPGDRIVVDGLVVDREGLEVDESLLTGEADPVEKRTGDQVMSGSFVVAGGGLMQATNVGLDSYATQLTVEARVFTTTHSELMSAIMRFVRVMSYILIPVGALLFWSQLQSNPSWQDALTGTVAGVVTMIPEGLVLLTSVAMAVAVVRLGRKRALVQEMPAVEVLARVDVVCVDKTGTLTEPGMQVCDVVVLDPAAPVDAVLAGLGIADDSPNPTQAAIAAAYPRTDDVWTVVDVVPFSSARKWSAARFEAHGWWVLGAPEVLLGPADPHRGAAEQLAAHGARVLLVARPVGAGTPDVGAGPGPVLPAAFIVIDQRLRGDVTSTVRYFLDQDVALKVISGDNPVTVGAIADQAGIPDADRPFDARELPDDVGAMAEILETHSVFGRVTPRQKRAMVAALQSRGHTVAMTGDGVNDVLALKDADLGIAMGSGAAATRAVAQIVLLDNEFSVMPSVVAEGRRVLGNIERVSDLFLTKSFYALVLALLTGVMTLPFPFLPRHLTVITFLTIGTPAFFMALMPNTSRFRSGFFARVLWFTIPAGVLCAAMAFTSYYVTLAATGSDVGQARVSATITLAIVALFVLYLVARPMDLVRWLIVGSMGAGFLIVLFTPWLSTFFALPVGADLGGAASVGLGLVGAGLLWVVNRATARWRSAPAGAPLVKAASSGIGS
jgi:cation-transporting P-type ATPase E